MLETLLKFLNIRRSRFINFGCSDRNMFVQFADTQVKEILSNLNISASTIKSIDIPNNSHNPFVKLEFTRVQIITAATFLFVLILPTLLLLSLLSAKIYRKIQSSYVPGYESHPNYIPPDFSDPSLESSRYSRSRSSTDQGSSKFHCNESKHGYSYRNFLVTPTVPMTINPVYDMMERARENFDPAILGSSKECSLDEDSISQGSSGAPLIAKQYPFKLGPSIPLRIQTDFANLILMENLPLSSVSPTSYLDFLLDNH